MNRPLITIRSSLLLGATPIDVTIEVSASSTMWDALDHPECLRLRGIPDPICRDIQARVSVALEQSGYPLMQAVPKGTLVYVSTDPLLSDRDWNACTPIAAALDLPIAIGLLSAAGYLPSLSETMLRQTSFLGKLALDGRIQHIPGVLPMLTFLKQRGIRHVFVSEEDMHEANLAVDTTVYPVSALPQLVAHLTGTALITPMTSNQFQEAEVTAPAMHPAVDMVDIKGHEHIKRAFEVAALGGHHILLSGAQGMGKTLLARAFPFLLPSLTAEEHRGVLAIYSCGDRLAELHPALPHRSVRPARMPHPQMGMRGLFGNRSLLSPGEVSLAHHGVLILDDLPAFCPAFLEVLPQVLHEGAVTLWRDAKKSIYPAAMQCLITMKPCPCGFFGDPVQECTCSLRAITEYQRRYARIMQQIDIHCEVPRVEARVLMDPRPGESSAAIRHRVEQARLRQVERLRGSDASRNARIGSMEVQAQCAIDDSARKLLKAAIQQLHFSADQMHRVLKVARTIADLADAEIIAANHLAEAIQYQPHRHL